MDFILKDYWLSLHLAEGNVMCFVKSIWHCV